MFRTKKLKSKAGVKYNPQKRNSWKILFFTLFCLQHCHLKCFDNNLARLNAAMSESELPWLCRSLDAGMSLGSDAEQKHSLG